MEKVTHFVLLMSISMSNIPFSATVSFMEHVIVVFVVLIVRMRCRDRMTCVSLLEVSLLMTVTNRVSLDIILLSLLSLFLEHTCVV